MLESGREERFSWPSNTPVWSIGVLLAALAVFLFKLWLAFQSMTLLQQYWFPQYCWTSISSGVGHYRLLRLAQPGWDPIPVSPGDVEPGETRIQNKVVPFQLTQQRLNAGEKLIFDKKQPYDNAQLTTELQRLYFDDVPLKDLLTREAISALWVSVPILILGLVLVAPRQREQARIRKYGRRIDGPESVSTYQFNRRNESDGIGFVNTTRATLMEWLLCWVLRRDPHLVRIPSAVEVQHILCFGDNGTGKTSILFTLLEQIAARGEIAILFDSALEFVPRFYDPKRGDIIANPLDARTWYWALEDEADNEPERLTLANSLFPDRPDEHRYFSRGTREVFAELLTSKPSAEALARWLRDDTTIDRYAGQGTYSASYLSPTAQPQRQGILSDLKAVGKAFSLLPAKEFDRPSWSTRSWAKHPCGWIFLPSTPDTQERLRQLFSLWLDLLALRLMNEGLQSPDTPRVWFILDELAALQRLPQLHNAVRASRKSNCVVVMCIQGRSQLRENYGIAAEVMLSQPSTKIYLRTNEAESARWISETIGEQELEVVRETRSVGHDGKHSKSFQLHIEKRLLIMPSLISGLKSLCGFLKLGNHVVRLRFPYRNRPKTQPGFVPRPLEPTQPTDIAASTNTNEEKPYWR